MPPPSRSAFIGGGELTSEACCSAQKRFEGFIAATLTPMDSNAKPSLDRVKDYAQKLVHYTRSSWLLPLSLTRACGACAVR